MHRYNQAREDFEFLESIVELDDQVELDAMRLDLMKSPTKSKAADMYEMGIRLWFSEHRNVVDADGEIIEIGERHGIALTTQGGGSDGN